MKQKKSFFTKNNRLNKVGNQENTNLDDTASLDPRIMAEYEKIHPGFATKLMKMAQDEQKHIHQMDQLKANIASRGMRMGRFSFIFLFIIISYFTYNLIMNGLIEEGYIFGALAFLSLIILNCKAKKSSSGRDNKTKHPGSKYRKPHPGKRNFVKK